MFFISTGKGLCCSVSLLSSFSLLETKKKLFVVDQYSLMNVNASALISEAGFGLASALMLDLEGYLRGYRNCNEESITITNLSQA